MDRVRMDVAKAREVITLFDEYVEELRGLARLEELLQNPAWICPRCGERYLDIRGHLFQDEYLEGDCRFCKKAGPTV